MFSFFRKKPESPDLSAAPKDFSFLGADMHSHLVPGIDDGAPDGDISLGLIRKMKELGYTRLITTPHVHLEFYDNNREKISLHFDKLRRLAADQNIGVELGVAAEYYLDNYFPSAVMPDGLLTFGDGYVLVEVSMAGWHRQFSDMIFSIQSMGYKPVLAHPERYLFEEDIRVYEGWKKKGVLLQMNLLALSGYYGKAVKMLADRFLQAGLYDFCGSDVHHPRHVENMSRMAREQPEIMLRLGEYPHWRNKELLGIIA